MGFLFRFFDFLTVVGFIVFVLVVLGYFYCDDVFSFYIEVG